MRYEQRTLQHRDVELTGESCILSFRCPTPAWRNWQTRWTQNPVIARSCGFEPLRRQSSAWELYLREIFESFAKRRNQPLLLQLFDLRSLVRHAEVLRHTDDWQSKIGRHRNFVSFPRGIVKGGVKQLACERGHELD